VKYAFYVGGGALLLSVMWTVFTTPEYPPSPQQEELLRDRTKRKLNNETMSYRRFVKTGAILMLLASISLVAAIFIEAEKEFFVLPSGLALFGGIFWLSAHYINQQRSYLGIVHMANDFLNMPRTMVQLAFVQFFSWFALFSMWIYTTPAVTRHFFGATDSTGKAFNDGADWVNFLFAVYNGVAAVASFILPVAARQFSRKVTHLIALSLGGCGLISFYLIEDANMLILSMVGVGIAWASILSIPYAMLSGALPSEKMGYYMGVFNFFIVIPQIVAGTILGLLVTRVFQGESVMVLLTGGFCMVVAGLLSLLVNDQDEILLPHSKQQR
jgi:maltose/moltooligosaccharide transporter